LPEVVPSGKALEQWTHNKLLVDAARLGLLPIRELVSRSMDKAAEGAKARRIRRECDGSEVAGKCADGSRKQDEAQLSAFMAMVDGFEAQHYGPTKKTAERQQAQAADLGAKEPEK
jgi:hypothetical protein